jgi:hypothetical protein
MAVAGGSTRPYFFCIFYYIIYSIIRPDLSHIRLFFRILRINASFNPYIHFSIKLSLLHSPLIHLFSFFEQSYVMLSSVFLLRFLSGLNVGYALLLTLFRISTNELYDVLITVLEDLLSVVCFVLVHYISAFHVSSPVFTKSLIVLLIDNDFGKIITPIITDQNCPHFRWNSVHAKFIYPQETRDRVQIQKY